MSAFLTRFSATLLTERTRSGRRIWQLNLPLVYQSDMLSETISVPPGFTTDLDSCPRFPPVAFALFGDLAEEAACIHDYLYTGIVARDVADAVLKEAAQVCGASYFQAEGLYIGVRAGGASHYAQA
jgi:hypothetical protein